MGEKKSSDAQPAATSATVKGFRPRAHAKALELEAVGAWMDMLDENKEQTGGRLHVYGDNAPQSKAADKWRRDIYKTYGRALTDDENIAVNSEHIARCCDAWEEVRDEAGNEIPFSVEALRDVFIEFGPLYDQVVRFKGEHRNFLPKRS